MSNYKYQIIFFIIFPHTQITLAFPPVSLDSLWYWLQKKYCKNTQSHHGLSICCGLCYILQLQKINEKRVTDCMAIGCYTDTEHFTVAPLNLT